MMHLLHGAAGCPEDWQELMDLLEPEASRAVDLYGGEVAGFEDFARDLNEEAAVGDVLIGYSMGGRLALHALLAAGAPWSKAVIISAHTGAGQDAERLRCDAHWAALLRCDAGRFVEEWAAQPVFGGRSMPWGRGELAARSEAVARGFEEWSLGAQEDLLPALGALRCPVLWLVGEQDAKYVEIGRRACARLPEGRLQVVAGSGHRVPWEQPEICAAAISGFLS